jgi:CRISPR-associated endonuclease/helicase Cas3
VTERDGFYRYWGKAGPAGEGAGYHLLPYHCLDVAAVGSVLLREQKQLLLGLAGFLGVHADALRCWFTYLLAIHDVGKFADGFQNLRPDLMLALQGRQAAASYEERHDTLGYRFCAGNCQGAAVELLAQQIMPHADAEDLRDLLAPWLNAVEGHHGRPPVLAVNARPLSHNFPDAVSGHATAFLREALGLFLPEGVPFDLSDYSQVRAFQRVSWLTAGLAVTADWIGSNQAWFPYCTDTMSLSDYWVDRASRQAEAAVARSGLLAVAPAPWRGLRGLFPKIATPTALQRLAEEIELSAKPQIFLIEEVTGGGKTEAALALAHRLMERRAADGIYLALPTMATANAMHTRVREMYRRLFVEGSSASLVLAHSASRMALAMEEQNRVERGFNPGEETGSRQCSDWLADSRKKALLAHVGVGTIDQALLAVLTARHQSMRLFGLCRKVLIVDEVHACDAYLHRLLCTLLRFHAALGGSAILLSATLPARMRSELTEAFAEGLGNGGKRTVSISYPLVTHLTAEGLREHPVSARESCCRQVGIRSLQSHSEVNEMLSQVLDAGGCACWVRNTVDDALDAYREWTARLGDERVTLFHARFALADRLRIESEVLRLFGPSSAAEDRRGRLLIATQVVEQSLDLDFDGMVSDLAPIDLVIQRAGRLKRHSRDSEGNPLESRDQRGGAELGVFLLPPIAVADARWFSGAFPRAANVYPHHGQLWLTARWLTARGGFSMPEDARDMIESVYGATAQVEIPEGLQAASARAEGTSSAMSAQGRLNSLNLDAGYVATTTHWQDDAYAPTRLGEPTVTVRLARWDGRRLIPWAEGDPRHAWQLSQVTVRRTRIAGEAAGPSASALEGVRDTMPDHGKYCIVVALEQRSGVWVGRAVNAKKEEVGVTYDVRFGLRYVAGDA